MNRLMNVQFKHFKGKLQEGSTISDLPQTTLQICSYFEEVSLIGSFG